MFDPDLLRTLSPGVFALLGTALGVIGALGIQRRTARLEREKLSHAVRGRVNALGGYLLNRGTTGARPG